MNVFSLIHMDQIETFYTANFTKIAFLTLLECHLWFQLKILISRIAETISSWEMFANISLRKCV